MSYSQLPIANSVALKWPAPGRDTDTCLAPLPTQATQVCLAGNFEAHKDLTTASGTSGIPMASVGVPTASVGVTTTSVGFPMASGTSGVPTASGTSGRSHGQWDQWHSHGQCGCSHGQCGRYHGECGFSHGQWDQWGLRML